MAGADVAAPAGGKVQVDFVDSAQPLARVAVTRITTGRSMDLRIVGEPRHVSETHTSEVRE
jgi:hypothetical protein